MTRRSYNIRADKALMAKAPKATALDAFIAKKAHVDAMIAKLQAASADHFGSHPDEVNWADVGSLGHVEEVLENLVRFMEIDQ